MGDRNNRKSKTGGKSEKSGKGRALEQELITHYASRVMEF
jgi:hypothetical protein